jgi:hypothetical protein
MDADGWFKDRRSSAALFFVVVCVVFEGWHDGEDY